MWSAARIRRSVSSLSKLAPTQTVPASGGVIRDDRTDQSYLDLGASAVYASVGRIDTNSWMGTGTLIAPDWVLTAGHVVNGIKSLNFTIGGMVYSAKQWIQNPNWTSVLSFGYDIAVVQLTKAVANIKPAERYYGSAELGKTATFVGFGTTGNGLTGASRFDGRKRAGQNIYDKISAGNGAAGRDLLYDFDNPAQAADNVIGASTPLNLEYLIATGDSGGGGFINVDGRDFLAGVHSYGSAVDGVYNSDYGDYAADVRVSAFNSWIDSILGVSDTPLNIVMPSVNFETASVNAVPEPASWCGLAMAGILASRRRNR